MGTVMFVSKNIYRPIQYYNQNMSLYVPLHSLHFLSLHSFSHSSPFVNKQKCIFYYTYYMFNKMFYIH